MYSYTGNALPVLFVKLWSSIEEYKQIIHIMMGVLNVDCPWYLLLVSGTVAIPHTINHNWYITVAKDTQKQSLGSQLEGDKNTFWWKKSFNSSAEKITTWKGCQIVLSERMLLMAERLFLVSSKCSPRYLQCCSSHTQEAAQETLFYGQCLKVLQLSHSTQKPSLTKTVTRYVIEWQTNH